MAFLGSIFVFIGIRFGYMLPLITVVVFAGIFAAFYFYAKRSGTVIGYPDGPIWSFREARDEAAGARMIIIPRTVASSKDVTAKRLCHSVSTVIGRTVLNM